jgi:hypothetical protein
MILRSSTEDENGGISLHRIWTPFPLMGKGRDRGAPEPIKTITPTFVLPRRGEGIRALPPVGFFVGRALAQPQAQRRTRSIKHLFRFQLFPSCSLRPCSGHASRGQIFVIKSVAQYRAPPRPDLLSSILDPRSLFWCAALPRCVSAVNTPYSNIPAFQLPINLNRGALV